MSYYTDAAPAGEQLSFGTLDAMQSTLTRTSDGRMPYFAALDGVRAYCILLVMFDHLKSDGHSVHWLNGHLGVDLFLIISGFLITTLLRREQRFRGRIDFVSFYWRRFFRIIPMYVVALLLYIAICQLPSQAEKWIQFKAGLPWFLSMMNEYAREPGRGNVFMHTWSLGVEEKFYLLWPMLFFWPARGTRARQLIILVLFVAVLIPPMLGHYHLARAYFGLLMGCVMGIVLSGPYARRSFAILRRLPPSGALLLFVGGFWAEHHNKMWMPLFTETSVVFLASMLARESWLSRLHTLPPVVWLGRRSYSMYLIHVLCLNVFESRVRINSGARAAGVLAAAFCLAAAAAEVLYRLIEQPARRYGRAYLARRNEIVAAI